MSKQGTWIVSVVILLVAGAAGYFFWTKSHSTPPSVDTHSAEGTVKTLLEMEPFLNDSLAKGDLEAIHDSMYYYKGIVQVLEERLTPDAKARLQPLLSKIAGQTDKLDDLAGGNKVEPTKAAVGEMIGLLAELKRSSPAIVPK